jgi:hypothetical protein
MEEEKQLSEKESLALITMMINKAKDSNHDTGVSAIMWGIIIVICSLVRLAEIQFGFRMPFDIYLLTIIAVIPQIIMSVNESKRRKAVTYDDVYLDYVWLAFGISIGLMILITNGIFNAWTTPVVLGKGFYEFVSPLFLLLYGMPTFITGAACKFRPMLIGGLICWVSCIITIFTPIRIDLLLVAASSVFAWLIPGIILEKDYRKAKKELAAANV